jgi:hypothetical protein
MTEEYFDLHTISFYHIFIFMEVHNQDNAGIVAENARRETQLRNEDQSAIEVPELGNDQLNRVTKPAEAYDLSGSLSDEENAPYSPSTCQQPGEAPESVDNVDDAGLDCTREPDWEVVKPTQLPDEPGPSQFHNDRYWDERSLDRELQEKDLQEEMIREEMENFDQSAEISDDHSRPFQNEVLDPYYQSGSHPSTPPSAGHSLDSFV